jgi:hypothetical protein
VEDFSESEQVVITLRFDPDAIAESLEILCQLA